MVALKRLVTVNGLVFLLRGLINIRRPTSFYLQTDAPNDAVDAVRVLGVTYGVLGLIQLGMSRVTDRRAVRVVSFGSLIFAAGIALLASAADPSTDDAFHRLRHASAAENAVVAGAYTLLLYRERQQTAHG